MLPFVEVSCFIAQWFRLNKFEMIRREREQILLNFMLMVRNEMANIRVEGKMNGEGLERSLP